jgi:integrase
VKVEDAFQRYLQHAKGTAKNDEVVKTLGVRLRRFFGRVMDRSIRGLDAKTCAALYEAAQKGVSADHHRRCLEEAKKFLRWCVDEHMLKENPCEGIKAVGRRRHGKAQLSADEAGKYLAVTLEHCRSALLRLQAAGERQRERQGARHVLQRWTAAAVAVAMGPRASEITLRVGAEIDLDGTIYRITDAKTAAGVRTERIPSDLQPFLAALAKEAGPEGRVFPHNRDWVRLQVRMACKAAGVRSINAHGARGTFGTLDFIANLDRAKALRETAAKMGHATPAVTEQSYIDPCTLAGLDADALRNLLSTVLNRSNPKSDRAAA